MAMSLDSCKATFYFGLAINLCKTFSDSAWLAAIP